MFQTLAHNNYETFFGFTQNLEESEVKFLRQFDTIKRLDWREMGEQEFSRLKGFDVVVFQGAETELKYGHLFNRMKKKTLRILDLFDSRGMLEQRAGWLKTGEATLSDFHERSLRTEVGAADRQGALASEVLSAYKSDLVWTGNEYFKHLLQCEFAVQKVQVINPLFEDSLVEKARTRLQQIEHKKSFRGNIRFDGDFSQESERDNLEYFLEQVWPLLSERLPTLSLDVLGLNIDSRVLQLCLKHRRVRPVVGEANQGLFAAGESSANYRPKHIANLTSLLYPGLSRW
jgi:hypothetical protein